MLMLASITPKKKKNNSGQGSLQVAVWILQRPSGVFGCRSSLHSVEDGLGFRGRVHVGANTLPNDPLPDPFQISINMTGWSTWLSPIHVDTQVKNKLRNCPTTLTTRREEVSELLLLLLHVNAARLGQRKSFQPESPRTFSQGKYEHTACLAPNHCFVIWVLQP